MSDYAVIMAGGVGSRFWPASRENKPKQFLDILGLGKSLIRMTYERLADILPAQNIYVVTHEKYLDLVLEHVPEMDRDQVICEPSRNNTAPCVAYAAYKLLAWDPDANIVIAPADHVIIKEEVFKNAIQQALSFTAKEDAILTLGIQPSRPDTGYGYIEMESVADPIKKAIRFAEKPTLPVAEEYLANGNYVWNAGLFIFRARTIQKAFATYASEIDFLLHPQTIAYNTANEQEQIQRFYPETPKISIDYAIMEKAENIYTLPVEMGWSDLGTWRSLFEESTQRDPQNNVLLSDGVVSLDNKDCLIKGIAGKLVVVKGLTDFMVIDEEDALLIFPKSEEQEIKKVRSQIEATYGQRFL